MLGASQVDRMGAWEARVRQVRVRDRCIYHMVDVSQCECQFEGAFRACYLPEPSQSPLIPCTELAEQDDRFIAGQQILRIESARVGLEPLLG